MGHLALSIDSIGLRAW